MSSEAPRRGRESRPAALRALGISTRFGDRPALEQVDVIVAEGEVCGLLGPNGAGKTTLLRILLGLVAPDAGSVELLGRVRPAGAPPALEGVAGFAEEPCFYPYLSARANLELCARLDGAASPRRVGEVLEQVGLGRRGKDRVGGYSTGMRKRLGIAASLLRAPRLLLLDEPTAGLDPTGIREVDGLIRRLAAEGVAVLLSSHQIAEVESVCDRFAFLRAGRVVWDGTSTELAAQAPASTYLISTSDDAFAIEIARRAGGVRARATPEGALALTVDSGCLDRYVVALGQEEVAIRQLELRVSALESMFFALTGEAGIERLDPGMVIDEVGATL